MTAAEYTSLDAGPYRIAAHRTPVDRQVLYVARWGLSLAAATIALCAVALSNGGPLLFPDTFAYIFDADRLVHLKAPFATRPVFYGLALWPFHSGANFYPAMLLQAGILAHTIYLTLGCCRVRPGPLGFALLVASLALLTPVTWYVAHLLPDIFVAILMLALFMLGFCSRQLRRSEQVYLVLLAAASTSFHLTTLPVGAAILGLTGLAWLVWDRTEARPLLVLAPLLLAVLVSMGFSYTVWQRATLTPNSPPHLLARIIADGPGRAFLAARCPAADLELCRHSQDISGSEEQFLWQALPSMPTAEGKRVKAEASAVIGGTVAMFPLQVARQMLTNTARQLVTFASESQFSRDQWLELGRQTTPEAQALSQTLQANGTFDGQALDPVNALHFGIALASLLISPIFLVLLARKRLFIPTALIATVLVGLLANAFACGALSGVFARYQGRIVWLLPFAAVVAAMALLQRHPLRSPFTLTADPSIPAHAEIRRVDLGWTT